MRFALVLLLALSGLAEAQVSACGPGKDCRSRTFTAQSPSNGTIALQIPNLDFAYFGASCGFRANGSNLTASSACNFSFGNGQQGLAGGGLYFANYPTPQSFTSPATLTGAAVLMGDTSTAKLWKSDGAKWTEVGSGTHPGLEKPTYFYVSDTTAGTNAPAWAVAPRAGGASVAFTSAGTLSNATTLSCSTAAGPCSSTAFTNYATTAVSGNQAHHSSAVWTGSAFRWSATVSVPTLTSGRFFAGMSNTLPLVAGSSTPTAHAAVFRYDSGIGANIFACTGAGAAVSCVDTGVAAVGGFDLAHRLAIDCREASVGTTTRCFFWVDGILRNAVTTTLPAARLGSTISLETLSAASRSFSFSTVAIEPL